MKSTSFRLPDDVLDALASLSNRYHTSKARVLEILIIDRETQSDKERNKERRRSGMLNALAVQPPARSVGEKEVRKRLYLAGYRDGWNDFQTRHAANPSAPAMEID